MCVLAKITREGGIITRDKITPEVLRFRIIRSDSALLQYKGYKATHGRVIHVVCFTSQVHSVLSNSDLTVSKMANASVSPHINQPSLWQKKEKSPFQYNAAAYSFCDPASACGVRQQQLRPHRITYVRIYRRHTCLTCSRRCVYFYTIQVLALRHECVFVRRWTTGGVTRTCADRRLGHTLHSKSLSRWS